MPQLVKDSVTCNNKWILIAKESKIESLKEQCDSYWIVPLSLWLNEPTAFNKASTGIWIDSDEGELAFSSELFLQQLAQLPLIAINFPSFMDGRGYSIARSLREHHDFQGELRAIGDILQDQLFYLKRCGFNAFDIRDDRDAEAAISALNSFEHPYQAAIDRPTPLFKRH